MVKYFNENISLLPLILLTNISSYIQKTENGLNLEVKIPKYLIGENLGFVFNDIDNENNNLKSNVISTFGIEPNKVILQQNI